jgi:LAO/AO transport system kinase
MDALWRRQLSRALSAVENRAPGWREIVATAYAARTSTLVVGVTGPPGAGKSTLIDALASFWTGEDHRVAVLAIDPASPFSGGALLGDRVRMRRSDTSDSVFIRSMSARGHSGGLNEVAADLCAVLASFGMTHILLETVGVGQNEVEVAFIAECTLVVSVPGLGDSVQTAKAGLLEVGDIHVVNKRDLPGAQSVARDLKDMLALVFPGSPGRNLAPLNKEDTARIEGRTRTLLENRFGAASEPGSTWHPPVVLVSASEDDGMDELCQAIRSFNAWLTESGRRLLRRREVAARQLASLLKEHLLARLHRSLSQSRSHGIADWADKIARRELDPHFAVEQILDGDRP